MKMKSGKKKTSRNSTSWKKLIHFNYICVCEFDITAVCFSIDKTYLVVVFPRSETAWCHFKNTSLLFYLILCRLICVQTVSLSWHLLVLRQHSIYRINVETVEKATWPFATVTCFWCFRVEDSATSHLALVFRLQSTTDEVKKL